MEEAVTRKFINEDSSSITCLCASVEACVSHGLKRRALGLFKSGSTTALIHKIAKFNESANIVSQLVEDFERRSHSTSEFSLSRTRSFTNKVSSPSYNTVTTSASCGGSPPAQSKYLWIRLALFEKKLPFIIDHLVENASKYYERDAFMSDSELGPILSSLLVGPCALEISKLKTTDHYFTDPPAGELVQRHKISSSSRSPQTPPSSRRPNLNYRRPKSSEMDGVAAATTPNRNGGSWEGVCQAKDYVESLHQNSKVTLLYGKNNVVVQPKPDTDALPGYMSLHQNSRGSLFVKWTPNELMNGSSVSWETTEREPGDRERGVFWDLALNLKVDDLVYLHCHQAGPDAGGTLVFVGQDGVPRPAIQFPPGGHLLAFLTCFETGLLPRGHLDPPLWSHHGKGKVFPCLKRRSAASAPGLPVRKGSSSETTSSTVVSGAGGSSEERGGEDSASSAGSTLSGDPPSEGEQATGNGGPLDFVFRILFLNKPSEWPPRSPPPAKNTDQAHGQQVQCAPTPSAPPCTPEVGRTSSSSNSYSLSQPEFSPTPVSPLEQREGRSGEDDESSSRIQLVCETMKRQIISRAFYGWLAHCRHLRTVRTHLSGLVHSSPRVTTPSKEDAEGLTKAAWQKYRTEDGRIDGWDDVMRLVYFGGVTHDLRATVWPYLLGLYDPQSTPEQRRKQDEEVRTKYAKDVEEWSTVEILFRRKEEEALQRARLSSSGTTTTSSSTSSSVTASPNKNRVFSRWRSSGSTPPPLSSLAMDTTESTSLSSSTTSRDISLDHVKSMSNEVFESVETVNGAGSLETVTSPAKGGVPVLPRDPEFSDGSDVDEQEEERDDAKEIPKKSTSTPDASAQVVRSKGSIRKQMMRRTALTRKFQTRKIFDLFGVNLHRIDKDVNRCDRNHPFFTAENLDRLRCIMCTYVWNNLELGYMQGMCDLVAPLLVVLEDETLTYACFCRLMERMAENFPTGGAMDRHLGNLRSLIQILDGELFELLDQNKECTHFFFCYRWFLLDFKRELLYDDIFAVWEVIWAAQRFASTDFVLFIALALVQYYRDIILDNSMDFTDIIKFFNEMAERHDAQAILKLARNLVSQLQTLIDSS
ncbi:unnamed protein product [Cyprideis torosa]|uniref:Uncharacterized protein n=1 Tax=Cyprideis torosa TaxID=163714 RepID=A0A7R8ZPS6_9CRUS|nr:unnamed protein product [Cyprideis torosa]CAG0890499.1 unnamed protein product [Cyprideis torosa]